MYAGRPPGDSRQSGPASPHLTGCCRYHIIGRAGLGANPPSEDVIQEIIYQDQADKERRKYADAGTQTPISLSMGDHLDREDEDCLLPSLSYLEVPGGEFS